MTAKEGQNMGVDRLLSAGLDCCIITKAEEGGPGQDRWSGQALGARGGWGEG